MMLVDLARNDVARIAEAGTRVADLLRLTATAMWCTWFLVLLVSYVKT